MYFHWLTLTIGSLPSPRNLHSRTDTLSAHISKEYVAIIAGVVGHSARNVALEYLNHLPVLRIGKVWTHNSLPVLRIGKVWTHNSWRGEQNKVLITVAVRIYVHHSYQNSSAECCKYLDLFLLWKSASGHLEGILPDLCSQLEQGR